MATTITTYEEMQTDNLITFSFQSITNNFKTIDSFIKNFPQFQRKMIDLEKNQKYTALELNNFKMSTTNTFSTMNEILNSRGSVGKGNSKETEQDVLELKKNIKEFKVFLTESTRDMNDTLQEKEKETKQVYRKYNQKLLELSNNQDSNKTRIEQLEHEVLSIKGKYALKSEATHLEQQMLHTNSQIAETQTQLDSLNTLLDNLGVKQFKEHLDKIEHQLYSDMDNLKIKFKLKADISDVTKLEQMLLNHLDFTYQNGVKKFANKNQTKKALIFMQKKINSVIQNFFAEEEGERDGLLAGKSWKCISCSKDLGEYEGKLDKYKAWSIFPTKQPNNKQKYSGFGSGFQSIVETAVTKKGGQIGYDEKGRMTTPFNLTRQNQGSTLKHSQSQNKTNLKISPTKVSESNYMNLYGRNAELDINVKSQYIKNEKGLASILKLNLQQKTKR